MAMDMRGTLNVSKFQKPNSNSPRFYGRCIIEGKTYNMKGWEKEGRDGPWISIMFEPLEEEEFEQCAPKKASLFSTPDEPQPVKKQKLSTPTPNWKDDEEPF